MMAKPPRLQLLERVDLPIVEASALTTRRTGTGTRVLVVGDRTTEIAAASYADGELRDWRILDLATLESWPANSGDSQFEAIACDGGTLVAVIREDSPEALVLDTESRSVVSRIHLAAPMGSPLHGTWDDPSSRGEGLVLLRGGRLLVAKEKRPRALVEFGPEGAEPHGLSREDFLDPGEPWDPPARDARYDALAVWKLRGPAKKFLGDISALGVTADRSLWLLSDKSQAVARLGLAQPLSPQGGTITDYDEAYRLPKGSEKPEGVCALDAERVLVALDTDSTRRNGLMLARP